MTTSQPSQRRRGSSPLCLRVTAEERRFLEARARECQQPSTSAYIRTRLFGMQRPEADSGSQNGRLSQFDRQRLLAQVLGALGGSKVFGNLSDLAEAARIGALPVTPDVVRDIRTACAAVLDIRDTLLRALGIRQIGSVGHDR